MESVFTADDTFFGPSARYHGLCCNDVLTLVRRLVHCPVIYSIDKDNYSIKRFDLSVQSWEAHKEIVLDNMIEMQIFDEFQSCGSFWIWTVGKHAIMLDPHKNNRMIKNKTHVDFMEMKRKYTLLNSNTLVKCSSFYDWSQVTKIRKHTVAALKSGGEFGNQTLMSSSMGFYAIRSIAPFGHSSFIFDGYYKSESRSSIIYAYDYAAQNSIHVGVISHKPCVSNPTVLFVENCNIVEIWMNGPSRIATYDNRMEPSWNDVGSDKTNINLLDARRVDDNLVVFCTCTCDEKDSRKMIFYDRRANALLPKEYDVPKGCDNFVIA